MNAMHMKFACDSLPDCLGQIVDRVGDFVIIEGMATDSGYWFAKGAGGARRFQSRQEAVDYIGYAQDENPAEKVFNELDKARTFYEKHKKSSDPDWMGLPKAVRKDWARKAGVAVDVSVSEAQHKAMGAAAGGKSNLGIPKKVGKEFSHADKGKFDSARDAERTPDQSDLNSAARGLRMLSMGPDELENVIKQHQGNEMFASKVIVMAAKQMLQAKRRTGARY